jgi:hypothetical protein
MTAATKTAVKLWIMWLVIGCGELAIFADTWRRVDGRYSSEGLITEALMCVIMGGIPGVAFAGVVYVVGEFLARQFASKARPSPPSLAQDRAGPLAPPSLPQTINYDD